MAIRKKVVLIAAALILIGGFFVAQKYIGEKKTKDRNVRLAQLHQWLKEDPLLFSQTMEIEKVRKSLAELEKEETVFVKNQKLPSNLFPLDFLHKFLETSEAFHAFDADATESNAEVLLTKMKETQKAYGEDLKELTMAVTGLQQDYKMNKIIFLGGDTYTTMEMILNSLEKMKENTSALEKEIAQREKCWKESADFCGNDSGRDAINRVSADVQDDQSSEPNFLSKKLINLPEEAVYTGPFHVHSQCWGDKVNPYLYVTKECPADSSAGCEEVFYLANEAYFIQVSVRDEKLREKDIEVVPQRATNSYTCEDFEYQTDLAVLDYFMEHYRNEFLFKEMVIDPNFAMFSVENKNVIQQGQAVEEKFFGKKYPSDTDMQNLGEHYARAYALAINNNLASADLQKKLLERALVAKEKMVNFDLLTNNITDFLGRYRKKLEPGNRIAMQAYVYANRSNYSFFYLNFSDAVWRLPEKPEYFIPMGRPEEPHGIYNYAEAVAKFGEENLLRWIDLSNKLREKN